MPDLGIPCYHAGMSDEAATSGGMIPERAGGHWLPEHRELALEVWAFRAGRSVSRTATVLAGEPYNLPISERTLRDWVNRYGWDQEADNRLAAIAPALRLRRSLVIDAATLDAAYGLARIVAGDAGGTVGEYVQAARLLLDAAGVTGLASRAGTQAARAASGSGVPRLSDEQRAALQARLDRLNDGD